MEKMARAEAAPSLQSLVADRAAAGKLKDLQENQRPSAYPKGLLAGAAAGTVFPGLMGLAGFAGSGELASRAERIQTLNNLEALVRSKLKGTGEEKNAPAIAETYLNFLNKNTAPTAEYRYAPFIRSRIAADAKAEAEGGGKGAEGAAVVRDEITEAIAYNRDAHEVRPKSWLGRLLAPHVGVKGHHGASLERAAMAEAAEAESKGIPVDLKELEKDIKGSTVDHLRAPYLRQVSVDEAGYTKRLAEMVAKKEGKALSNSEATMVALGEHLKGSWKALLPFAVIGALGGAKVVHGKRKELEDLKKEQARRSHG